MKLLLDTHVFLWFFETSGKLSPPARQALTSSENECYLSIVSVWEMQIKIGLGKLSCRRPLQEAAELATDDGLRILPVNQQHIYRLASLADYHHDPFDRLIIAQAMCEDLTIVTRDKSFPHYGVPLLW